MSEGLNIILFLPGFLFEGGEDLRLDLIVSSSFFGLLRLLKLSADSPLFGVLLRFLPAAAPLVIVARFVDFLFALAVVCALFAFDFVVCVLFLLSVFSLFCWFFLSAAAVAAAVVCVWLGSASAPRKMLHWSADKS